MTVIFRFLRNNWFIVNLLMRFYAMKPLLITYVSMSMEILSQSLSFCVVYMRKSHIHCNQYIWKFTSDIDLFALYALFLIDLHDFIYRSWRTRYFFPSFPLKCRDTWFILCYDRFQQWLWTVMTIYCFTNLVEVKSCQSAILHHLPDLISRLPTGAGLDILNNFWCIISKILYQLF